MVGPKARREEREREKKQFPESRDRESDREIRRGPRQLTLKKSRGREKES